MNILLCNGKGGTGKTTMTVLLAHALAEAGKRVAIQDRDPQGTASKWLKRIENKTVSLYDHAAQYDAVFTDTPPHLTSLTPTIATCSVAVLVCSPSPADIWTTLDTAEAIRPHLPAKSRLRILFNGVLTNTVLARELPEIAKQIGVKPLSTIITRRQCYQHAALYGWTALDQAAREEMFRAVLEIVTEK